ncbi:hypothetical protein [Streptomyces sp. NPDC126503]|uniref:hypothetical protein n=1 Tax=Streptomyces sp. NPDC126503 TaxID=3155315 RepID=UPI0033274BF6
MNRQPVPLPAEHIPSGAVPWRTADAQRWLAATPGWWAHPAAAATVLAGSSVWDVVAAPVPPCTSADPCGADWPGLAAAVVLVLTLYWVWRQPRLALAGLGGTLAVFAVEGGFSAAFAEPSALAFLTAAAYTAAGLVHRLAVAGRQRARALAAAGSVAHPLPAAARTFRRGRFSFLLAALLLAVAAFGCLRAGQVIDAYEERAAGATRLTGRVTGLERGDDADVLTVEADGRTHRFETAYPEDFPLDSRVDVVVEGDWAALVAEPYDIFGWELLVLAGSVAGLAFFANGVDGRTRAKRLRRAAPPVLRVLVREGHEDGRTWVFAADDPEGLRPVLSFRSLHAFDDREEDEDEDGSEGEDGAEEGGGTEAGVGLDKVREILKGEDAAPPLREAVLYGVPCAGAEVVFVAPDGTDGDEVSVECSVTAVKPAAPASGEHRQRDGEGRDLRQPGEEGAVAMTPTASPRLWRAHGFSRAVGLVLLVLQGGGIWAALDDGPSWSWLWLSVGLVWLLTAVATALTWRITADRGGLWITGAWRVRRVPWEAVIGVRHSEDRIRVDRAEGSPVVLSPTGWAWLERRLGRAPHAVRAAEELRALLLRPELRPLEEAPAGRQGMPVGPPLTALSVLWGAAVLLLL